MEHTDIGWHAEIRELILERYGLDIDELEEEETR